jgi:hypothetical protein
MRLHRLRLGGLVTAATVAGALAICAAPASAALVWRQVGEISGTSLPRESFGSVDGVAADDFSDQAWLADSGGSRLVYEFDYSGTFVAEVHGNETPVGGFGCHESIAAYNATGEVYVTDPCDKVVFVLNSVGKYLKELTGTELEGPEGIAVDQATGNIWVADPGNFFSGEQNVDEYNSKDEFVKKFKVAVKAEDGQMAFDGATGDLLLSHQSGEVFVYSQTGALLETWTGSVTPNKGFGYQPTLAANDATGDVYVTDKEHKVVDVLTSKDEYVGDITDDFSEPHGLAVSQASGKIFVSDLGYPGHVYIFSPEPVIAPDVTTGAAEKITRTTAVVHGTVNPVESEAGVPAKYYFQAYNGATAIESAEVEVTGNTTQEVTAELTGLVAGATYEYRLVAKDANGLNKGEFKPFTTHVPIEVINTAEPTEITSSSATLHGELNPDGYQTTCWFEYTDGRRPTIKTPEQNVGDEEKVVDVSQPITGLEPNSGYGFTFICKNSFGQSESPGSVGTLTAPPAVLGESTSPPSRTSAILLANVNPENSGTTYFFEYGPTSNYGYKTHEATLGSSADEEQRAEGLAFELETDKTYHFRVVAKNAGGTTHGPDVTFESGSLTPPGVQTGGVSAISPSGATVEGVVSTSGLITSYGFEITTDESDFGPPTGLGSVGAGFKKAPVRLELTGLAAKTTYYYKLVGTNQDGSDEGEVHQFTTAEYPPDQIAVSVLPVLTEPLTTWPSLTEQAQYGNEGAKAKAKKPAKCKRGFAKKHGKCVKKRKGKSKRKK